NHPGPLPGPPVGRHGHQLAPGWWRRVRRPEHEGMRLADRIRGRGARDPQNLRERTRDQRCNVQNESVRPLVHWRSGADERTRYVTGSSRFKVRVSRILSFEGSVKREKGSFTSFRASLERRSATSYRALTV